jgi:hypothetical protein
MKRLLWAILFLPSLCLAAPLRVITNEADIPSLNFNFDLIQNELRNTVHKTSTETITGYKTFDNSVLVKGPSPWIDVKAYGARGDGSTDDTTSFQSALSSVPASGGVVFVSPGTYIVTTLSLSSRTKLECSPGAVIKLKSSAPNSVSLINIVGSTTTPLTDVWIDGCEIDGNMAGTFPSGQSTYEQVHAILVQDARRVSLTHLNIHNVISDGIAALYNSSSLSYNYNSDLSISDVLISSPARNGISLTNVDRAQVSRVTVLNYGDMGIDIEDEAPQPDRDIVIENFYVVSASTATGNWNREAGVQATIGGAQSAGETSGHVSIGPGVVQGSTDVVTSSIYPLVGVNIRDQAGVDVHGVFAVDCKTGFQVASATTLKQRTTMSGNHAIRARLAAFSINHGTVFTGNTGEYSGLGLLVDGNDNIITSNLFVNNGNYSYTDPYGIYVSTSRTRNIVNSNTCLDDRGASGTQTYGIKLTNTSIGNTFIGNIVSSNVTGGFNIGSTDFYDDNIIKNNKGFKTDAAGVSSINSGTTSVTITHGLDITPKIRCISITASNNSTNDIGHFYINNVTSTQFDVNVRSDPGVGGINFNWQHTCH